MSECWIKNFGIMPWLEPETWLNFYSAAEEILSAKLSNLDTNDPPRRKVKRKEFDHTGEYTTDFGSTEQSRWIFGRFKDAKVEMTLQHYRTVRSDQRDFPNSLTMYFPDGYSETEEGAIKIERVLELSNRLLKPFYSFADLRNIIVKKKKPQGAVNIQEELLGIFWLTFFNNKYVDFFGREKMDGVPGISFANDGVNIKLAQKPTECSEIERLKLEKIFGAESFVDPKVTVPKGIGKAALSFEQLQA
jgi:hypothetical protein